MAVERRPVTFETVQEDQKGQRIDNFLSSRLKGVPKSRIYRLLRKGEVRVNKGRVKPQHRLDAGDIVRIPPVVSPISEPLGKVPEALARQLSEAVVFENSHWMVVNKPCGLAVHGGSGLSMGLIEALRQIRDDCHSLELCHRIDKDTSGCLVVAKKRSALRQFHAALREKKLTKIYHAAVVGRWPQASDAISLPLQKNILQSGERMVHVSDEGKPSRTLFRIIEKLEHYTVIEAQPVTGRTHQIRVHARAAGHPIIGDSKYGNSQVNQKMREQGLKFLFLHARSITLPDVGELKGCVVESSLPLHWEQFYQSFLNASKGAS
jgi:23S rRNA pseudouridine955/2504/2580 synthase